MVIVADLFNSIHMAHICANKSVWVVEILPNGKPALYEGRVISIEINLHTPHLFRVLIFSTCVERKHESIYLSKEEAEAFLLTFSD